MEIYHYCSEETFRGILDSKKLWITPIDGTNDKTEMIHLYDNIWKKVKVDLAEKNINTNTKMFEMLELQIESVGKNLHKPYLTCFSQQGDLLSQWREYGDKAKGVSIGFNPEWFKSSLVLPILIIKSRNL